MTFPNPVSSGYPVSLYDSELSVLSIHKDVYKCVWDRSYNIFSVYNVKSIGANTTEELLTEALVVMEGEILKVTAADAEFATAG